MLIGVSVILISIVLGVLPVAAFSGTVYVSTPWDGYFGVGVIFGLFLIFAGIISRISPNMMEGDALWVMKMGPGFGRS